MIKIRGLRPCFYSTAFRSELRVATSFRSFVDNKSNKQWVWLALDVATREIVGVYIGARDEASAQGLWNSLPPVYRQCAVAYTDFWAAYATVLPNTALLGFLCKMYRLQQFS